MFKSVLVVLVVVCFSKTLSSSYEKREYETLLTKIMDEDWEQSQRLARDVVETKAGSGCDLKCEKSESTNCKLDDDCTCNCSCNPGYKKTNNSGDLCEKTKQFGGTITFSAAIDDKTATETINAIYKEENGPYIECEILPNKLRSTIVNYILHYKNVANVNERTVKDSFNGTCNCSPPEDCMFEGLNINKISCDTVTDATVLCSSPRYVNYCDASNANCSVTYIGYVECPCMEDYERFNDTTCYIPVCKNDTDCNDNGKCMKPELDTAYCVCEAPYGGVNCEKKGGGTCTKQQDCNHPFGWCEKDTSTCTCMWGFQGAHCYEPWLFTLTVVASGCTLIIIILLNVAICCSRKKSKKELTTKAEPMDDLTNPFTDFQPGIMRAKVPGRSIYSNLSDPMPKPANGKGVATSSFNGQHERSEIGSQNGHVNSAYTNSNYGYASIDKTRKQSGYGGSPNRNSSASYGSPKRGSNDYF